MDRLSLIKRIAAVLLMVCMFLPLSQCTGKADPSTGKIASDQVFYGYKMAADGMQGVGTMSLKDHAILLVVIAAFLAPLASLALPGRWEPAAVLALSLPVGQFLWYWVVVIPDTARVGGIVAIGGWIGLILISGAQLWRTARSQPS